MDGVASVRPRRMGSRLRRDNPFQPGGDAFQDLYPGPGLPHTWSNRIPFRIPMRSPFSGAPPRIPFPTPRWHRDDRLLERRALACPSGYWTERQAPCRAGRRLRLGSGRPPDRVPVLFAAFAMCVRFPDAG